MVIYSRKNQYVGVNAHLMSILQTPGTEDTPSSWRGFHNHFIAQIMEVLNAQLPEGYVAVNEESLQILGEDDEGAPVRRRPAPDVTVYQQRARAAVPSGVTVAAPTWQAIEEFEAEERFTGAVVIYQQTGEGLWGKVVTRIELLSRSNKRGGSNWIDYRRKRRETFLSRIPLVEIDLLHESRSPILDLPVYPTENQSYPYTLSVSDPRSDPENVPVQAYGFHVDSPFPTIPLPLAGESFLAFNLDAAYQNSYERGPWHVIVDYEGLPPRFDTYQAVDQERIRARMQAVIEAQARGESPE